VNGSLKLVAPLVAALAIAACNAGGSSNVPATAGLSQTGSTAVSHHIPEWQAKGLAHRACPQVVGKPMCLALISNKITPACSPSSGGCGWIPSELEAAYDLGPSLGNGSGTTVAVVEAGDDPTVASDLNVYRSEFGLGTANITRYNQNGVQGSYPPSCEDYGWCVETNLDVQMISASCPKCNIAVMEAGGSISDFEAAEASAVSIGATIVSNSWSCPENWDCGDTNFGSYFDSPGIAYLASTGDDGYNTIGAPSDLASVIAVGGTQLHKSGSTYTETVWIDASAGCSSPSVVGSPGVPKPSWQHDPDCTYRTDGDVSAESGCSPAVAEYISTYGTGEWISVCGTSVASPFTAGVIALAGNAASIGNGGHFWSLTKKQHKKELHVIKSGDDGFCGGTYLCTAGEKGKHKYQTYAGPVGWGTPNGITAY
jgi:subtilase family serine protease